MSSINNNDLMSTFRAKAIFMKTWKPASAPSNRDRLEMYALHKQAVSGDAPESFPSTANAAEKAKYQAWRQKSGITATEAMRLYLQESDRQLRVYGSIAAAATTAASVATSSSHNPQSPATPDPSASPSPYYNTTASNSSNASSNGDTTPRGLAAIPLLCAAACESRPAYLRRLAQTPVASAWWKRQEALCGTPGTLGALPETVLLEVAKLVESISLNNATQDCRWIAAFLWPAHNVLLNLWILLLVLLTLTTQAWQTVQILVWGARRTGISLDKVWNSDVQLTAQCVDAMCAAHQSMACRLIGLILLPIPWGVNLIKAILPTRSMALSGGLFVTLFLWTWWYWYLVLPWLGMCLFGTALSIGGCFVLMELAEDDD